MIALEYILREPKQLFLRTMLDKLKSYSFSPLSKRISLQLLYNLVINSQFHLYTREKYTAK